MIAVLLVIHLIVALLLIGLVLLQRSEGGGLGIGGNAGGGMGNFASPRSTANMMTKATTFCGATFFATSLLLGVLATQASKQASVSDLIDEINTNTAPPVIEQSAPPPEDISPPIQ